MCRRRCRGLDQAKSIAPDMPQIDYKRASALQMLGRFDEAVTAYGQAIARDPADVFAHHRLNHLLYRTRSQARSFVLL